MESFEVKDCFRSSGQPIHSGDVVQLVKTLPYRVAFRTYRAWVASDECRLRVSDCMCGAQHMAKGKSAAERTGECVKQGSKYALVVGNRVYTLEGQEADLDRVTGTRRP